MLTGSNIDLVAVEFWTATGKLNHLIIVTRETRGNLPDSTAKQKSSDQVLSPGDIDSERLLPRSGILEVFLLLANI